MKGTITTLIRHGTTDNNGEGNLRGWPEVSANQLTEKGKAEALATGGELLRMKNRPDILVPSDLNRAVDSARIISKMSGIPHGEPTRGLRSQDMGKYTGKNEKSVRQELQDFATKTPDKKLPGSTESHNDFVSRIKSTISSIKSKYPNKKIGIITHHQVERLIMSGFGKNEKAMFADGAKPGSVQKINL